MSLPPSPPTPSYHRVCRYPARLGLPWRPLGWSSRAPLMLTSNLVWFLFYMIFGAPSVWEYHTSSADSGIDSAKVLWADRWACEHAKSLARMDVTSMPSLSFSTEKNPLVVGRRSMCLPFPSISSHEAGIVSPSGSSQSPVTRYPMPEVPSSTPGRLDH